MKITVNNWKNWMSWKDHIEFKKSQEHLPWILRNTSYTKASSMGGITIYSPPKERTTLSDEVFLTNREITSYKKYQEYTDKMKAHVRRTRAAHKRMIKEGRI